MSRYRGPRLRIVRRLGELPGLTTKTSKKLNPPGQHGASSKQKLSQYSIRLREKQKLRYNYGVTERQLLNYVKKSRKGKGSSGKILLTLLEMRLDNTAYRLRLAPTIVGARQLVSHGHILVNGKSVNIPSYQCQPRDILSVKNSKSSKGLVEKNLEALGNVVIPDHLSFNKDQLEGKVNNIIDRKSVALIINELLVVEYYSRKV
uniref:Ribosomal protein S4 n=1 Tax=Eutreptiella pomquetensis TaxID=215699 RepID=A0A223FMG5_9EUGL|nr:ribosomal protein S4 [Eutreptiella pomquetensis]